MAIGVDIDQTRRSIYSDARRRYNDLSLSQLNIIALPHWITPSGDSMFTKFDAPRAKSSTVLRRSSHFVLGQVKITTGPPRAMTQSFPPSFEIEEGLALLLLDHGKPMRTSCVYARLAAELLVVSDAVRPAPAACIAWRNRVQHAHERLKRRGFAKAPPPFGLWSLKAEGKAYAANIRRRQSRQHEDTAPIAE